MPKSPSRELSELIRGSTILNRSSAFLVAAMDLRHAAGVVGENDADVDRRVDRAFRLLASSNPEIMRWLSARLQRTLNDIALDPST